MQDESTLLGHRATKIGGRKGADPLLGVETFYLEEDRSGGVGPVAGRNNFQRQIVSLGIPGFEEWRSGAHAAFLSRFNLGRRNRVWRFDPQDSHFSGARAACG